MISKVVLTSIVAYHQKHPMPSDVNWIIAVSMAVLLLVSSIWSYKNSRPVSGVVTLIGLVAAILFLNSLRAVESGRSFKTADISYEDPLKILIEAGGCAQVQLAEVDVP